MPTLTDEQQQPTSTEAPPSQPSTTTDAVDWKRKYDGLQGQFDKVKRERDDFAAKVTLLTTEYEGQLATLTSEKATFEKAAQEKTGTVEQLQKDFTGTKTELDALKLVLKDYSDLAPLVAKGTLRIAGLQGDELTTYLTQAREDLKGLVTTGTQQNLQGASPAPPSGGSTQMTLQELSDKKIDVLRKQGAFSKEYQDLQRLEDEMMRKSFGKPS